MNFNNLPKSQLHDLNLKPFAFNNRGDVLPNLWCLCRSNINHVAIFTDDQHVSFTLSSHNLYFGFSVVYASTYYIHRRNLWQGLSNLPWSFIGEFNDIISIDKYKGSHTPAKIPMVDLCKWSDDNHSIHLPTVGNKFTWTNGRKGMHFIEKRSFRLLQPGHLQYSSQIRNRSLPYSSYLWF